MKITEVRPLLVGGDTGNFVIVKVETDRGIVGYGEASLHSGTEAVVGALQGLRYALIDQDPGQVEKLWLDMYRYFQMIRGGVVYLSAISGIDQALWDIKGKALGAPVYELLGGRLRNKVPAFRYGLPIAGSRDETKERALAGESEGWQAFHGDPFGRAGAGITGERAELDETVQRLMWVREAVDHRVDIAIDCHGRFAPAGALRVARLLEGVEPIWFEEPVPPENTEALAQVARACPIPIAAGERLFTRHGYRELFEKGGAAFIQPDVCHVGGISEMRKVAAMAEVYHIALAPHMIYSPLALAATLQVDACIPNLAMQGIGTGVLAAQQSMFVEPVIEMRNGWFTVPTAPGLGVEIDEEKLARQPYRPLSPSFRPSVWEQWYLKTVP